MKRKFIKNSLIGFFAGISFNVIVGLLGAFIFKQPFTLVTVHFEQMVARPLLAIFLQVFISGGCGAWLAFITTWLKDDWSFLKQLLIHFVLLFVVLFPVGILLGWIDISAGLLWQNLSRYFLIYLTIYLVIWLSQMIHLKQLTKRLNAKLKRKDELK